MSVLKKILCIGVTVGLSQAAWAFTLHGPVEGWQTEEIGYDIRGVDIGGPKNLGEEYRWTMPVLTYAFDRTFLNYFGQRGVEAVEAAIATLNALPRVSTLSSNLTEREFQGEKRGVNHQAAALGLLDLKTHALATLIEEMGLASPDRYTWTLRSRVVINNVPIYNVIRRNFDPVTLWPTPYVNGTLYTYQIVQTFASPDVWEAVEIQVDPATLVLSSVAAFGSTLNGTVLNAQGSESFVRSLAFSAVGVYFSGLTRDDVGGLRYLLHPRNVNIETLPPNTTGGGFGGGGTGGGGTDGSWADPFGSGAGFIDAPWGDPFGAGGGGFTNIFTNIFTNVFVTAPVDPALRPGVDKITFRRVDYDSFLGLSPGFTNSWIDTYLTNRTIFRQRVSHGGTTPDILFAAGDLGIDVDGDPFLLTRTIPWQDNSALNTSGTGGLGGPGTIVPTVTITFSWLGPTLQNIFETGELDGFFIPFWGSFDGTTNEPVVFPDGVSIRDLEDLVLRRR
ncbi:MAG: hypothetical protein HYY24_02675 [Verrucomicrobia bacterium]|nr:hypothetical protein [Verrucomicrobiota bacterium]